MNWRIFHAAETASTNRDAAAGVHGDVFTADFQSAGRGRLDHKWLSDPGSNLMMSVVLDVSGLAPETVATLPLVIGLCVVEALADCGDLKLKWPNDVLADGRKLCGILCERNGDRVIAGIGVNVNQTAFAPGLVATSVKLLKGETPVRDVRDAVLGRIGSNFEVWRTSGFAAFLPRISACDFLKGRMISVCRTDDDFNPATRRCGGIALDGALIVNGERIYSGEAHVKKC